MNKSELICFEWLKEQGHEEEDILFSANKSPDFKCSNGKKYEAKKLYGDKILFSERQLTDLDNTLIVVVDADKEKVVKTFEFDDKDKLNDLKIIISKKRGMFVDIAMDEETREEVFGFANEFGFKMPRAYLELLQLGLESYKKGEFKDNHPHYVKDGDSYKGTKEDE